MILVVEMLALSSGIKECGFGYEALAFLVLALIVYGKFPWVLLFFAAISIATGLLWRKGPLYRTLGKLLFLSALIVIPTVAFLVAPHTARPCTPI